MSNQQKGPAMKTYRQGDVLIVAIDNAPENATSVKRENGRVVLAHGEVTGHSHAILDKHAELVTTDDRLVAVDQAAALYLLVHGTKPVDLVHQEHDTITIDPGHYKVIRQTEYTPERLVQVQD